METNIVTDSNDKKQVEQIKFVDMRDMKDYAQLSAYLKKMPFGKRIEYL